MNPPSQDQALPRLVIDSPDRIRGQVHVLDFEPLLVGRDSACQIQLLHPQVSRRHALVWWANGHTTVEDLSSTNGTRLNGHLVLGQQILHSGDVLDFGPLEVHYEEPSEGAATAVAEPGTSVPAPEAQTVVTGGDPPLPVHEDAAPPEPPRQVPPELMAARPVSVRGEIAQEATAQQETAPQETALEEPEESPRWGPPADTVPPQPPVPPAFGPLPDRTHTPQPDESPPGTPPPETPHPGTERRFDVAEQQATGNLSNVGGNQYNYLMQDDRILLARRKAYFRKLRATRRTGRHLALVGLLLAVLGFAFRAWLNSEQQMLDPDAGGVAVDMISLGVGIVGTVLLVIGAALVATTVFRQRRYEREEERRLKPDRSSR
ncbi:FHA domain-containing protein [Streptomyces sp. TLI_235]|nr:FHA domain-containing protein [Streptomyces sp. TLI_235]PBC67520.1 FHA domain-containing protein [Streptomyces sp. TLI_235]